MAKRSQQAPSDPAIAEVVAHTSPIGRLCSTWTQKGLYTLGWKDPVAGGRDPVEITDPHDASHSALELDRLLAEYFRSGDVSFQDVVVDSTGWASFAVNVYRCCRRISSGDTKTYKELAIAAGNELASRAVGAAMARNRVLLVIPCHRVVSGQGQLRGFSARGGLATKRQLLELERNGNWPTDLFSNEP